MSDFFFFVECPSVHSGGWAPHAGSYPPNTASVKAASPVGKLVSRVTSALKRPAARILHEGVLLITQRQALLLRDVAPPDASMTHWGYSAQSWPLGRLIAADTVAPATPLDEVVVGWPDNVRNRLAGIAPLAEVATSQQLARLLLVLDGSNGAEIVGAVFPPEGMDTLRRASSLLAEFAPWQGAASGADRRLRHSPTVRPWRPNEEEAAALESLGEVVAPEQVAALTSLTEKTLISSEHVLAQARTPSWTGRSPSVAALVTLTQRRLLIAQSERVGSAPHVRALMLSAVTSATLHYSLLGSALTIFHPGRLSSLTRENRRQIESIVITFPSPLIAPFRALFTRLRVLLNAAIRAGSPQ